MLGFTVIRSPTNEQAGNDQHRLARNGRRQGMFGRVLRSQNTSAATMRLSSRDVLRMEHRRCSTHAQRLQRELVSTGIQRRWSVMVLSLMWRIARTAAGVNACSHCRIVSPQQGLGVR